MRRKKEKPHFTIEVVLAALLLNLFLKFYFDHQRYHQMVSHYREQQLIQEEEISLLYQTLEELDQVFWGMERIRTYP